MVVTAPARRAEWKAAFVPVPSLLDCLAAGAIPRGDQASGSLGLRVAIGMGAAQLGVTLAISRTAATMHKLAEIVSRKVGERQGLI
jgi:hypothetical protein